MALFAKKNPLWATVASAHQMQIEFILLHALDAHKDAYTYILSVAAS